MSATADAPARYRAAAARPGPLGLIREAALEVWDRRRLIGYLVQADVRKKGADTLLGNLWWVIDPLLQMAVYVVLVSLIFHRDKPDYPVFIFAAILPWKWFQTTIYDGISSVTGAGGLIRQVQFPKLVLPVASSLAAVWNFCFGLIPLVALIVLLFPHRLSWTLLLIPAIAVVQLFFNLALAIGLGALNVFFRDIGNVARHAMRLWFYLSPGLYALSDLQAATEKLSVPLIRHIVLWNPFAILFNAYRDVIYGTETAPYTGIIPDWGALGALLVASLVLLALATLLFKRVEPAFAKVL
jgi:ABC-type polysaccharide/polyol phosphate export permease